MSIVQVITKLYLEGNKLEVLGSVSDHSLLLQQQVPSLKFSHLSQHTNGPSSLAAKLAKIPKPVNQVTLETEPLIAKERCEVAGLPAGVGSGCVTQTPPMNTSALPPHQG